MALIGETRSYGTGLDLSNSVNLLRSFNGIFSEAKVVFTTGKLIELIPENIPYVGLTPVINTILSPIPSFFIDNKSTTDYIFDAISTIYGSRERSIGAAFLNFAEYYYMGGWFSVIFCSSLIGMLYKFCWKWYLSRRDEILAQVIYITNLMFAYVLISRGAMPQAAMIYFFTIMPLIIFYYKLSKRVSN